MRYLLVVAAILFAAAAGASPDYHKMSRCIATVESGNDPVAVGDGNRAAGTHQLWKIAVRECNRLGGSFTYADRFDPDKSHKMCVLLLTHYHRKYPKDSDLQLMYRWRNPNGKAPSWYKKRIKEEWTR